MEILYASDVRGADPEDVLAERPDAVGYASGLVRAAVDRRAELDAAIGRHSVGWPLERMSTVDRNVLRVAVLELLVGEVPPAAVIDEAVEIAKRYSGEEAGRFVNGVLGAVLQEVGSAGGAVGGGAAGGGGGGAGGGAGAGGGGGGGSGGGGGGVGGGGAGGGGAGAGGGGAGGGVGDGAGGGGGGETGLGMGGSGRPSVGGG